MNSYIVRFWLFICSLVVLTACGGGGSSSSIDNPPPTNAGSSTISLAKTTLQLNETTTVTAKFVDANAKPASGVTVTFSTTLGTLNPVSSQVVTDSTGTATIQLVAGSLSGSGIVTATAIVDGRKINRTASYSVNLPSLHLSTPTLGLTVLSYGGSTSVSVLIQDSNGATYTAHDVDVLFTSTQAVAGKSTLPQSVRSVNGIATATYKANTAVGFDTIVVSLADSVVQTSLTVNPADASSIQFISAVPANIGLKGMGGGGIQETSTITFKVLDVYGQPRSNQQVNFSLNTTVGGLGLVSSSASTDSNGLVSTVVKAGTIATPVRVTAVLAGVTPAIATQSDSLVISTGIPSQDGFSISIATLNPEAFNYDGVTDIVTARLSDHFHNPVPDGTAVYFTTSGGSIQPSCTTTGGSCSVFWTSQNPRPVLPSAKKAGRAVILAYAVGEEAFTDLNGNGFADAGEFTDMTGAFRDDNEDGFWTSATEPPIPFNFQSGYDSADGKYNGVLQGSAYIGAPKSKHVFRNSSIVMATSSASIVASSEPLIVGLGNSNSLSITVSDINGNTMPAGTTVEFKLTTTIDGSTVVGTSVTNTSLKMPAYDRYTFPNSNAASGVTFSLLVSDPSLTSSAKGVIEIKVTTPKGVVTTRNISVN